MASKGPPKNKGDTAGERKYVTLKIPHELGIIRRLVFDSVLI